ncbi:high mobility group B protein 15-like [Magnolia sinica]|uniref:high mobility group B protein 15-like n=1 Tax=Magnolia sinica TaxID=86752 RepID=UPI002659D8EA|nr:high mobility group B protein 15-like [Magnolia sinica]
MSHNLSKQPPTQTPPPSTVLTIATIPQKEDSDTNNSNNNNNIYPLPLATYEEVVASADFFMQTLEKLHKSIGTKFMVPTLGGKALDLHRLFVEVTSHGGLEKVIRDRKWREVISVFSFPSTITNASFVLRKYYISLLQHYEQLYFFRKQGQPISMNASLPGTNTVSATANLQAQPATPSTQEKVTATPSTQEKVPATPSTLEKVPATPLTQEIVAAENQSGPASAPLSPGCSVIGTIDGKFDNGYLVTVSLGSEKLKGVLYHVPLEMPPASRSSTGAAARRRNRKRSRRAMNEPSRPKPNRSGYNFFFQEHCAKLLHSGEESVISKKIGYMWSKLSEAEKEVYQQKGMKDKERYRNEMLEYKKSSTTSMPQ